MDNALDIKTLLARINQRIVLLRTWISHDHTNTTYWWARHATAPLAQYERNVLRRLANLLHVERATRRGRIHGTRFATLDEQRQWLEQHVARTCRSATEFARLPSGATLAMLRGGELPI